ncbi:hypothetical protein TFLX_05200 [Thermoflexales bacterium]|nr:hypothetical protein TFLX_05200 [Thermoflexales bacterium]
MSEDILLCPACGAENDALRQACVNCGQSLIVVCPRCNTVNAITAEQCFACGQPFDTLGQIMARHEVRFTDRFTRQATTAIEITAAQKESDRARSQQLWAQEQQRQDRLANQLLRRKAQERQLLVITAIAVLVVLAIVLLIAFAR